MSSIQYKQCVLLVLLDMSAAFDTINHFILLDRLNNSFGVTGSANAWFKSYFTNRYQCVNVSSILSQPINISCGMPQGSVLGPKGYPLYVSPIFSIARKYDIDIHMYADDTQLYTSFNPSDWAEAKEKMENCIKEISEWLKENHLKLNEKKTEIMIVCKDHLRSKIEGEITLSIGDEIVKPESCVKNLGAYLDNEMSMKDQIKNVCRSCYASLHSLGRIRKFLDEDSVQTLVHAFITCKVDSLNGLLSGVSDNVNSLNKLQMILNTAARLIFRLRKYDHITDVLIKLHWLPIQARIDFKLLILTYKALNGDGPAYLADLLHLKRYTRNTRAAADYLVLVIPDSRLKSLGDRSFSYSAAQLWNSLPLDIRSSQSLAVFKGRLKTLLFKRAYSICD